VSDNLTEDERALVERARSVRSSYGPEGGGTACALRTAAGDVFTGAYVETTIGTAAVHAEAAAVADAVERDSLPVEAVAAVSHPGGDAPADATAIIPPCGTCRELLYDYGPTARVVVGGEGGPRTRPVAELLPDAPRFEEWRE
jgi:cytidine deaminase